MGVIYIPSDQRVNTARAFRQKILRSPPLPSPRYGYAVTVLWLTRLVAGDEELAVALALQFSHASPRPPIIITFSRGETSIFLSFFFLSSVETRFTPLWIIIANNLHWPARGSIPRIERDRQREDRQKERERERDVERMNPSSFLFFLQLFLKLSNKVTLDYGFSIFHHCSTFH